VNKRNDGQDTLLPLFKCYNYLLNVSSSRSCIQCHVKGQGHECMIVLFQDSLCCLSKPEDKPELDHIRKKWMTPSELVRVSIHLSSVHYLLYKTSLCGHQVRQVGFLLALWFSCTKRASELKHRCQWEWFVQVGWLVSKLL